ncbi:hypothetical protein CYMTET_10461 [Cymbomonas tetramitiformis]|uniref:Uncharacterized protein n=1 Tax=Cymbomonas tetramitiformis TaxID=36881 RepID=A0AAE0GP41_9CHLO|nr:hypothetical protein CYMTET_10461 [Cymbomonas tetramitiformis]
MQNRGREQWQQRGRVPVGMDESREAENRRNMHTIHKEFSEMEPATLAKFSDGAKIPLPLSPQFSQKRAKAVQRAKARDKTVTDSAALEEFYSEDYGDARLKYTKRARGYPLERQHGVLDDQGHVRYNLLKNCTTIDGSNLDEDGFPSDNYHITVGPLRAHPREAVELLNHIETVLRILHEEGEDKKIICREKPPGPSNELKGKSINDLEADLLLVEGVESALKGHRLQGRVAIKSATWVKLVMVSEEAAQRIENKTEIFPGLENYEVQRVASVKEVDKQTETEVVVVDGGDDVDPEFEVEALACAVGDYFKKALGAGTHLVPQLAVPTYRCHQPEGEAVKAATSNRGEVSGDAESAIKDLGNQVKGLSEKVEKGFKDTVDNVKKVNASVDNVDKGVKQEASKKGAREIK